MTRRLLLSYLSVTAFVLLVLEVPLAITFARGERDRLIAAVERDASVLATLVEDALEADAPTGLDQIVADYQASTGGRAVIVERDGLDVADSDPPAPGRRDFSTRPEIAAALRGQRAVGSRYSQTLDANLLYVAVPVASGGTVHGAVRLTYPTAALDQRVRRAWIVLALVAGVVLGAVTLSGFTLARWVTGPVRALEDVTGRLAGGDLGARTAVDDGPPEVRRLAEAVNDMAARLAGLLGAQRAFVADASHELRTPLTALRLRLENLQEELPARVHGELDGAIAETDRLSRMVQALLRLARAEAASAALENVDLGRALAERVQASAALAAERRVRIVSSAGRVGPVLAVSGAAEQIIDNLLANAVQAAPPGTSVECSLTRSGDGPVELHVVDHGPGLDAEQRRRAFDRFWRAPSSRPGEGTGLGLAIVRQFALASRAEVELRETAGAGIDAVVRFRPALPAVGARRVPGATAEEVDSAWVFVPKP